MNCPNCGNQNPDGTVFCSNCGARLDAAPAAAQPSPNYTQPQYQPPVYTSQPQYADLNAPLTIGNYLLMFLIMIIPIVNIVMLFVWACGSAVNVNKKRWAIATLIWMAIGIVLAILLSTALISIFASLFNELGGFSYYY